jgi:imidazolonepropionase-like amidohydrolase
MRTHFPVLRTIGGALFVATGALPLNAQITAIRAGRLLDPVSGVAATQQVLLVEGTTVRAVGAGTRIPDGARVIDLSDYTVLPGLIDAHVHLGIGGLPRDNARSDLQAGFTTVVDLGARTTRLLPIRDSINAGVIPGPRVLAAGIWVGTKDGVCEFNGIGIAGGPDAFGARVRENVTAGADLIKVCVSGWPAAAFAQPDAVEIAADALRVVVERAHDAKKLVIAHDISRGGVKAALAAGVDGLAHAAYFDQTLATEARAKGMFVVTTLASLTGTDSSEASKALTNATGLAYRSGVTTVFGTDGGVLPHGQNAKEFAAMARAGITPIDAIRAATINAARALRIADSVGTIAPGMSADIIAVRGDPLRDLTVLERVDFVMLRGKLIREPAGR